MPGSHDKVDYRLRPAKNIERKMMLEVFQQLVHFGPVKDYRYLGFGSVYFADYSLFHRALCIEDMISLESDEDAQKRVEFNKPFGCIQVVRAVSTDYLAALLSDQWAKRSIFWLDYDNSLTTEVLTDVGLIARNASSGSVLLVTIDTRAGEYSNEQQELSEKFEDPRIREPITQEDRDGPWGLASRFREILHARIVDTVSERNRIASGKLVGDVSTRYDQLFHFRYADSSATMLTVGGLISDVQETENRRRFLAALPPAVRAGQESLIIQPPKLTFKELRTLDRLMLERGASGTPPAPPPVRPEDRNRYEAVYRYFPTFVEADF
jgi:hypothetical protein